MTEKTWRAWDETDLERLKQLWPSALPDKEIARRLGRNRVSLHKKAKSIGLKPRLIARVEAYDGG